MSELETKILTPPDDIQDAQQVRRIVFQHEQGVAEELDFDGEDEHAVHIVIYDNMLPVGTARIRFPESPKRAKIERVAVLQELRGKYIGQLIMKEIDQYLRKAGTDEAYLDAQEHAKGFYEVLGYVQEGFSFEEVGIPHVRMIKRY